jgi:hypothetical protein
MLTRPVDHLKVDLEPIGVMRIVISFVLLSIIETIRQPVPKKAQMLAELGLECRTYM